MRKIAFIITLSFVSILAKAQGIKFQQGSWKEIVALAKKEHKLIFIDIFTDWCGPCKMMDRNLFPQQASGDLHNKNFINYKIDAEKGEGIELAKKYNVTAYPTNLFINADNEEIVLKEVGFTELNRFLERGTNAILEYNDPMKWDDYVAKYNSGKYDKSFLFQYMDKARRTQKNYDDALNSFVTKYTKQPIETADLTTLVKYTETFDNKAIDIIYANLNKAFSTEEAINSFWEKLTYNTVLKAVDQKSEAVLTLMSEKKQKFNIRESAVKKYAVQKIYYRKTRNVPKFKEICKEEANYFLNLSKDVIADEDAKGAIESRAQILMQLKAEKVPEEKYESSINATMAKYPEYSNPASMEIASTLNETAWGFVESEDRDTSIIDMAMAWSQRSLDMTENTMNWPLFADTYAHLLLLKGKKDEAIKLEEKAIAIAKDLNPDQVEELQQSLDEMRK